MIYSGTRDVYISFVQKARKDNSVVKKGESYIRVKQSKYSNFELFKNKEALDKKYPRMLQVTEPELRRILDEFKTSDKSSEELIGFYFNL